MRTTIVELLERHPDWSVWCYVDRKHCDSLVVVVEAPEASSAKILSRRSIDMQKGAEQVENLLGTMLSRAERELISKTENEE